MNSEKSVSKDLSTHRSSTERQIEVKKENMILLEKLRQISEGK